MSKKPYNARTTKSLPINSILLPCKIPMNKARVAYIRKRMTGKKRGLYFIFFLSVIISKIKKRIIENIIIYKNVKLKLNVNGA